MEVSIVCGIDIVCCDKYKCKKMCSTMDKYLENNIETSQHDLTLTEYGFENGSEGFNTDDYTLSDLENNRDDVLTPKQERILILYKSGMTAYKIAKLLGVYYSYPKRVVQLLKKKGFIGDKNDNNR